MRDNAISLEHQATYKGTEMAADGLPIHYPPSRRLYGGGKAGVETRDGASHVDGSAAYVRDADLLGTKLLRERHGGATYYFCG